MKKHLFLLLLPAITLLLQGCQRVHCPGYPRDDTDYLPVDFVGQTMRYIYDGDTIAFKVAPPMFSEEYDKPCNHDIHCEAYARVHLESPDLKELLRYERHCYGDQNRLTIWLYTNHDKSENVCCIDPFNRTDLRQDNVLPQWTSPTGYEYTDVVIVRGIDTFYLSANHGLLHWYIHDGHTLTLLP